MSVVLYENESLKLVESENTYFLIANEEKMRVVFNENCKINMVCVEK